MARRAGIYAEERDREAAGATPRDREYTEMKTREEVEERLETLLLDLETTRASMGVCKGLARSEYETASFHLQTEIGTLQWVLREKE